MVGDNEMAGVHAAQRTPGSLWVGLILAAVGVTQWLVPSANYVVIAAVLLSVNFTVGLVELYMPMFSGEMVGSMDEGVDATVRVPVRQVWQEEPAPAGMRHDTAVMKLLIGG